MSLLDDLVTEIETYPQTYLTVEIIEVDPEGQNINAGEEGTFAIQVANSGPLDVRNLRLLVTGKNGTDVKSGSAGAVLGPTAFSNPVDLVPAHQPRTPVRVPGSRLGFEAPAQPKPPGTVLFEVSIDTWETDLDHPLLDHSDPVLAPSTTYSDEVLPRS